jgi:DNA polymerase-3 subunit epsilon
LTKEFIEKNGKTIKEIADDFLSFIDNCDFLTYNGNTFDIQFLYKDFNMFGYDLKLEERKFYDAYAMECTFRPRTLSFIYHDYTGKILDGAHNAIKDVEATIEVFKKQQEIYGKSWEELDSMHENNLLTPDGSIRRPSAISDQIIFARGKYKDCEFTSQKHFGLWNAITNSIIITEKALMRKESIGSHYIVD